MQPRTYRRIELLLISYLKTNIYLLYVHAQLAALFWIGLALGA